MSVRIELADIIKVPHGEDQEEARAVISSKRHRLILLHGRLALHCVYAPHFLQPSVY